MDTKEYNRLRYNSNPPRRLMIEARSHAKKLEALGFTISWPDDATLAANIAEYLSKQQRRERLDWGSDK